MYEVRVRGLRFSGSHGVFEAERATGNEFLADIVAQVSGSADESDELAETVDYGELSRLLIRVSEARSYFTVERLAAAFADAAMERFPLVGAIEVTIAKLTPAIEVPVQSCGVRLARTR